MALNNLSIVVDAVYKGTPAFAKAQGDVNKLNTEAKAGAGGIKSAFDNIGSAATGIGSKIAGVASGFAGLGIAAGVAGVAFAAAAGAARRAWDVMGDGAELVRIEARFSKLAESIGSTSIALTSKLRAATHGTISDMQLMASASQLISLRLADNEDQVVRLGAVAGTLNWDMQQVILTFANMSKLRLDALNLSVSDVTQKAEELELQGMSSQEAFKEAVILAGEAQKALLDVGNDAVRQMQQSQAGWQNAKDQFKMGMANVATEIGFTGFVADAGDWLSEIGLSDAEKAAKDTAEIMQNMAAMSGESMDKAINSYIVLATAAGAGTEAVGRFSDVLGEGGTAAGKQLVILTVLRNRYAEFPDAVAMIDDEIASLNETIAEQVKMEALAAAGGRQLADIYTEWATATTVAGEQAQAFVGTFNDAIGAITAANIDAGPLISFGEAADGAGVAAGSMQFSIDAASVALYDAAKAAGASASELAMLGVATGQFTEAEADAALKTAILQEAISRLAQKYADGAISVYEMGAALREQMAIVAGMPSMFAAASRQMDVLTGHASVGGGAWYRPNAPLVARDTEEIKKATTAVGGFAKQVDYLGEARKRLSDAFSREATATPEAGLIDASGVVNMENANKALYEQAQAAGATAGQLALLGVATGQFTEEQAQAALKAAILQEKIKQIAAGVASGELSYSDAAGGLASFGEALNTGAIANVTGGIEGMAAAATEFADGAYQAELSVESAAAMQAINEAATALGDLAGTYYVNIVTVETTQQQNEGDPNKSGPIDKSGRIGGRYTFAPPSVAYDLGRSSLAGRGGRDMLNWQGDGAGGGTTYNVTVNNYIDGQKKDEPQLTNITTDKIRAALTSLGVHR